MFSKSEKIWAGDWFIVLTIGMILLLIAQLNLLQPLERVIYDWSLRQISRSPGDQVAVIAIDDHSLAQLGEWPWSRTVLAQVIDLLRPYNQKALGLTLEFTKPQKNPGQSYIDGLVKFYANAKSLQVLPEQLAQLEALMEKVSKIRARHSLDRNRIKQLDDFFQESVLMTTLGNTLTTFEAKLQAARIDLNSDQQLVNSFKQAGNVVLAAPFMLGKPNDNYAPSLPDYMQKHRLKTIRIPFDNLGKVPQPPSGVNAMLPLLKFANSVSGLGYFNPDASRFDARRIPMIINYKTAYFPSLSLLLAAKSLQISQSKIEVQLGKGVRIGQLRVNTDAALHTQPFFYHDTAAQSSLSVDSFVDVLQERIPAQKYQDKIVLLGMTAPHYSLYHSTPLGNMPSVLVLAHTLTSLLNQDLFTVPNWALWLQISVVVIIVIYMVFLLPLLKLRTALIVSGSWVGVLGLVYFSLLNQGLLVPLMLPILWVPLAHISLQIKWAIAAYHEAFHLHPFAKESNRLLGLAFQGQGHLDLAFEKFRLCPPDEAILGLLYNLALDYERKRQLRQASEVYRYLSSFDAKFRDIEQRQERLRHRKKPKLLGNNLNDLLLAENNEKPVLGGYQIEKQVGKGAMGVVYLGKDTKLNRLVAIKTLSLSQTFDKNELQQATIWFFQEASAAGRLTHPHIVSVYEAGEALDLAYISMEFLEGGNLVHYTQPENLLPISTVIQMVIQAAEALDYAHRQGVVHRDIKPANIMYNPATYQIKITDFGIARLIDFSKTKTGTILGTPPYMSPEQLAGKPVDGRTDLFSLGVMLYQLLAGILPFQTNSNSSIATLMFKIANESPTDIMTVRADVPPSLKRVVDRALQKEVTARFQSGAEFANALRDCDKHGET